MMQFDLDELLAAKAERNEAWRRAMRGEIDTATLYGVLTRLRRQFGQALYDR